MDDQCPNRADGRNSQATWSVYNASMIDPAPRTARSAHAVLGVLFATLIGGFVRILPAWASDFPLNDGGLFYLMSQEIQNAQYSLPWSTTYNAANIPFAYPPLGLYLVALLSDWTPWHLIDLVRLMGPVVSTLTVPLVALVSYAFLGSTAQMLVAASCYALLPRGFEWLIMGGGVTRALGVAFALLTVYGAHALYTTRRNTHVPATAVFAGLTLLSHPEAASFAALTVLLLAAWYGRTWPALWQSVAVAAGALLVAAPGWATILLRYGSAPLVAALGSGWHSWLALVPLLSFVLSYESLLPVLSLLALLGLLVCLTGTRRFIAVWFVATLVLLPRSGPEYAMVPLALLAALGLTEVVAPRLATPRARTLVIGYVFVYALVSAWLLPVARSAELHALSAHERQALDWAAANTPSASQFLVITGAGTWDDATSEWFPVLARRVSLATVQGYEWL
ncbi:MAG TPA: hypothetical protein VM536_12560, partial [Chloroflexia bacterium]|nr:hypothetical protein [Chloroflexia bacterium]